MRRWAIINTLLGVVVLLLGVEIVRTWARGLPVIEVVPRAPAEQPREQRSSKRGAGDKTGARGQQGTQDAALLTATIGEKDLFDPSRRAPSEDAKTAAPVEAAPPPDVTVVGMRILGKDREVFLIDKTQNNVQRRLRVGDPVGSYTVKAIEPTAVTLASPTGETVTMPLTIEKGKAPATPPRPAPRPAPGGQPVGAAAGGMAPSPAAGVQPKAPPAPAAGQPNPALPDEVRKRLEQLRNKDAGKREGRKR
jgi:hypothetical protein